MGVMRTPSNRSSQSLDQDSEHSDDPDGGHSIDKHHWNKSFGFLRRGSSKKKKDPHYQSEVASLQSLERQDFSDGLKPEHAAGHQPLTRVGSDASSRAGSVKSPSLPTTPLSPRSPTMPHRGSYTSPTSSPLVSRRSTSPRRPGDYGFASAVTNIVDQAHHIAEQERVRKFGIGIRHEESMSLPNSPQPRGKKSRRPPLQSQANVIGSPCPSPRPIHNKDREFYRSTSLETRSRTPSPTTTPSQTPQQEYYGTANLTDRSRSPSPASTPPKKQGRKLPSVPPKPSTLNLAQPKLKENLPRVMPSPTIPQPLKSPGNINFPRLNVSPTHAPKVNTLPGSRYGPPPPGKCGRPEPYSPTERNNLNKITAPMQSRTLPQVGRPSSHERESPWNRERSNHSKYSNRASSHSPEVNRNNKAHDRTKFLASDFDEHLPGSSINKGNGQRMNLYSPAVPNGVKSKTRKKEKLEMRSDSNIPLQNDSDEDESDWC